MRTPHFSISVGGMSTEPLIKFLAQVVVDQYFDELRQQRILPIQEVEGQLAGGLPCGQGDAKPCPKGHISNQGKET